MEHLARNENKGVQESREIMKRCLEFVHLNALIQLTFIMILLHSLLPTIGIPSCNFFFSFVALIVWFWACITLFFLLPFVLIKVRFCIYKK